MSILAVSLLTLSAFLHAGWNLLGKKVSPTSSFFLLANGIGCLCLSPLLFFHGPSLNHFPKSVWELIFFTGLFQAIYMWGLASAYRHGSISVAYPLLRALPVLFVALLATVLKHGAALTTLGLCGIIVITIGCILIPIQSFRHTKLATFFNKSCLFALISATGTVGYTLIDNKALLTLRGIEEVELTVATISLLYLFLESLSCTLWLLLIVLPNSSSRQELRLNISQNFMTAATTGIAMSLTYALVLASMAFVENVSYVVAFRQLSIPIAVILGVYLLKEHASLAKFVGTITIFSGVILISLGSI